MSYFPSQKKRCRPASICEGDADVVERQDDAPQQFPLSREKRCRRVSFADLLRECSSRNMTRLLWKVLFEENDGGLGMWLHLEKNDPSAVLRAVSARLHAAKREQVAAEATAAVAAAVPASKFASAAVAATPSVRASKPSVSSSASTPKESQKSHSHLFFKNHRSSSHQRSPPPLHSLRSHNNSNGRLHNSSSREQLSASTADISPSSRVSHRHTSPFNFPIDKKAFF